MTDNNAYIESIQVTIRAYKCQGCGIRHRKWVANPDNLLLENLTCDCEHGDWVLLGTECPVTFVREDQMKKYWSKNPFAMLFG